ncbi:MAG: glycosyltransferase family 4 protein [Myxococcota bacterium]
MRRAGLEPDVRFEGDVRGGRILRRVHRLKALSRDLPRAGEADLLFIHRRTFPPPFDRLLLRCRCPVIFDMDDALDLPPPSHLQTARARRRFRRNLQATVDAADLVLCGNAELKARVRHHHVEILPTPIDCARFQPSAIAPSRGPDIGWVGHSDNLGFVEGIAGALRNVAERLTGARIVIVADQQPELSGLEVEFRRWTLDREVSCFDGMRVGMMPLDDTPWTRAKCSFKLLQFMALGIPTVASPVGMNTRVIDHGRNGLLAATDEEWIHSLDRLLRDEAFARSISAEGRRSVVRNYSLEVLSPRLTNALLALLPENRRPEPTGFRPR